MKFGKKAKLPINPQLPMILRAKVRDVLSALPKGMNATLEMIRDGIREGFGYREATDEMIAEAMEWNHSRNFIDYQHNYNMSRDEWFITERGRAA